MTTALMSRATVREEARPSPPQPPLQDRLGSAARPRALGQNLPRRLREVFSWEAAYRKYRAILDGPRGAPATSVR
jgi:hypothetical protein